MASEMKPIRVWGKNGPNPPKVQILLEELGLPYEAIDVPFADVKKPAFLAINPNGRMPAIYDPNTDLTLWESGAIYEYLVERYDTARRVSFDPGTAESAHAKQWLFFQVSGQGPYYGQAAWFKRYHPEPLPSAVDRYVKEINRITGVLESHLAQQKVDPNSDGPWLVGNKCSYADIAFVPYQVMVTRLVGEDEYNPDSYPHVKEWLRKMVARPAIKGVLESHGRRVTNGRMVETTT